MELEEYLHGLRNCPDEPIMPDGSNLFTNRFTVAFGIYDNWDILLKADFNEVVRDLIASTTEQSLFLGQYKFVEDHHLNEEDEARKPFRRIFEYLPGVVVMQVIRTHVYEEVEEVDEGYKQFNFEQFNMSLCLHPYQKRNIEGVSSTKAMTMVISDVAEYAKKKKLTLCFPDSIERAHDKRDLSRIVYYDPQNQNP
jgi:hypothetical protein